MTEFGFVVGPMVPEAGTMSRQALAEVGQHCEDIGLSIALVSEHHQMQQYFPNPQLVCGFLAAHTERLHVGTGVSLLPLTHPMRLYEEAMTLQELSGGRFVLGVGAGYDPADFKAFDVDVDARVPLFEESLEALSGLLRSEDPSQAASHGGNLSSNSPALPSPKLAPPLWVGAMSAKGIRRAASYGDCWLADPGRTVPELAAGARRYRASGPRSGGCVAVLRDLCLLEGDATDEVLLHALDQTIGHYRSRGSFTGSDPDSDPRSERSIFGEVNLATSQLANLCALIEPEYVIFRLPGWVDPWPEAAVHRTLDSLASMLSNPALGKDDSSTLTASGDRPH